jgi:hypothetical protein
MSDLILNPELSLNNPEQPAYFWYKSMREHGIRALLVRERARKKSHCINLKFFDATKSPYHELSNSRAGNKNWWGFISRTHTHISYCEATGRGIFLAPSFRAIRGMLTMNKSIKLNCGKKFMGFLRPLPQSEL